MLRTRASLGILSRPLVRYQATAAPQTTTKDVRPYSEVPGPKPLPLLGNSWRFLPGIGTFQTNDSLKWSADMRATYGDIVKITGLPGRRDMLMLFDPAHFEQVYRAEGAWPERFLLASVQNFRNNVRPDFFEGYQGLVNENGANWQAARSVVNPPMMQPKVARQFVDKMDQVARDFVRRMASLRDTNQEMPADFSNDLQKWALESIALIALDTRLGCLEKDISAESDPQKMIDAVRVVFDGSFELDMKIPFWKLFPTPQLKKFNKHSEIFLQVCLKYVERARAAMSESTPEGEMSVLQKILRRDPSTKRAVIMAMDMILAGIDTTSHTAAGVLYHLARNPERQERLFQELTSLICADAPLTADVLENMKYLRACIREAIRLFPVTLGNSRILDKEIVLDNYRIKENVEILMFNSNLYHMDKHFPSADKFIPERWLRGRKEVEGCPYPELKTHPFVYLPFGHGPRQCVGMRFANLELETLVARVVRNFRLEWRHGELRYVSKMLNVPSTPLRYRLVDRS